VITASPRADGLAVTTPDGLTDISELFELRQVRFGMLAADFVVPSAWRMLATNWADWPFATESGPITWMPANGLGLGREGVTGDGSSPHATRRPTATIANEP
jgi:hypothetical protein